MANDNMNIITVMTRKGGAGKTTLTRSLVSAAMQDGMKCLVLDADPQQALWRWANKLSINDPLFEIEELKSAADLALRSDVAYEEGLIDYIFIDTIGAAGTWADELATFSDALVVPMMLSDDDLEITKDTYNWYVRLRDRTNDPENLPKFHVVMSNIPPKANKAEVRVEQEALKLFPVMGDYFMSRKQHKDVSGFGFLHVLADERRNHSNPLMRIHAKYYDEALDEARSLLAEIVESV